MAKSRSRRSKRGGNKTSSEAAPSNDSGGGYEAPTSGYEDVLYAHGTTKAAAVFGTVNTKLARYVSVQSWTGATIAGTAMEKMAEPKLIALQLPSPDEEYDSTEDQEVDDPDDVGKKMTIRVTVRKTRPKQSAILKMETDVYMLHYKVWITEDQAWKTNRSRLYALILQHCPPDLEEVLKTMSAWQAVCDAQDAVGLLKMVRDVLMTKRKRSRQ